MLPRLAGADVVLLDLGLPDIDGLDVLASLRRLEPRLPVIVLTARDEVADTVAALDAGADDYLSKPFAFDDEGEIPTGPDGQPLFSEEDVGQPIPEDFEVPAGADSAVTELLTPETYTAFAFFDPGFAFFPSLVMIIISFVGFVLHALLLGSTVAATDAAVVLIGRPALRARAVRTRHAADGSRSPSVDTARPQRCCRRRRTGWPSSRRGR